MNYSTTNKYSSIYLLSFCLMIFVLISWKISPFTPDDSYISFRYAENLAHNKGLTFNPGETPVEGYTNFLWILFLALIARLGIDIPLSVRIFGIAIGVLCIIYFWFIIKRRQISTIQQVIPLLLLSCSSPLILYSVSGMETSLFSLLLLISVLCFDYILQNGDPFGLITLSIVSFMLALCRPEGVIFYPLIFIIIVLKRRQDINLVKISLKWLILSFVLFVFLMTFYEIWRINYFGEYLPTPFLSKGGASGSLFSTWKTNLRFYFITQNHFFAPFGYYYFALLLLALSANLHSLFIKKQFSFFETGVLGVALAFVLIYVNFVDWMPGMRYYSPIITLFLISSTSLFKRINLQDNKLISQETLNFATIIILILTINFSFVAALRFDAQRNEESTQKSLVALGKWLKLNVLPNTLLAISDVGATPYYSNLPTLDFNPKSLTDISIVKNGWSNGYILEQRPGIVIFVSFSLVEPKFYEEHYKLLKDPQFFEQYHLIGKTRSDWYGDRSYWIYAHNSILFTNEQLSSIPQGIGH